MGIKKWKWPQWVHTWLDRAIAYQLNVRYSEVRIEETQKWKHRWCQSFQEGSRRRRRWYWSWEEGRIQKSYRCPSWEEGSWSQSRESCWCRSSNSLPASSLPPLFLLPSGSTFTSSSRHPYQCVTLSSSYYHSPLHHVVGILCPLSYIFAGISQMLSITNCRHVLQPSSPTPF